MDIEGKEAQDACLKNLHMFWWPQELPEWTKWQWCSQTWRHQANQSKVGTPSQIANVKGKTVLVTGGDTGLGYATMKALALSGADVSYTSRHCQCEKNPYSKQWPYQCEELNALRSTVQKDNRLLKCYEMDLLVGDSVMDFVRQVKVDFGERGLDVLVNNAGLVDQASSEIIFNANFLGTYAVTKGLWNVLLATAQKGRDVRIITTSSVERLVLNQHLALGAFKFWDTGSDYKKALLNANQYLDGGIDDPSTKFIPVGYSFSKFADLVFALRLQKLIDISPEAKNITVFSTHPGATHTLMMRNTDVGQMTRDQGVLPNLLAISQPLDSFSKGYPHLIGPALNQLDMEYYSKLDSNIDDRLKQALLSMKVAEGQLDEKSPVEGLSCLQMVGFPMQYAHLRMGEKNPDVQQKLWNIAEGGLEQLFTGWHDLNVTWTGLKTDMPDMALIIV